jgi:hypothetical protein
LVPRDEEFKALRGTGRGLACHRRGAGKQEGMGSILNSVLLSALALYLAILLALGVWYIFIYIAQVGRQSLNPST